MNAKSAGRMPLLAGNWKMNYNHLEAIALVQKLAFALRPDDLRAAEVVVLPPFTDLRSVQTLIDADKVEFRYGGQDLSIHDSGAFTGEVSGAMLAKLGATYVVVGHSERREYHAETNEVVNAKVKTAIRHGLIPILCVGEGLAVRQSGDQIGHTVGQLAAALADLTAEQVETIVIAYEPIWAIGTGEVATPADAQEVCGALRGALTRLYDSSVGAAVRILYGGSVKATNIAAIMAQPDVDGALVGGASLDPDEFVAICRYRLLSTDE